MNDTKATLKADYGIYYFITDMASFKGNVKIYDSKSYTITSNELDYFRSVSKSYARGNVKLKPIPQLFIPIVLFMKS